MRFIVYAIDGGYQVPCGLAVRVKIQCLAGQPSGVLTGGRCQGGLRHFHQRSGLCRHGRLDLRLHAVQAGGERTLAPGHLRQFKSSGEVAILKGDICVGGEGLGTQFGRMKLIEDGAGFRKGAVVVVGHGQQLADPFVL